MGINSDRGKDLAGMSTTSRSPRQQTHGYLVHGINSTISASSDFNIQYSISIGMRALMHMSDGVRFV